MSNGFVTAMQSVLIPLPQNMGGTTVASLTLPAGAYILMASLALHRDAGSGEQAGFCTLAGAGNILGYTDWALGGLDTGLGAATLVSGVQLLEDGEVVVNCAHTFDASGSAAVSVTSFGFAATQVGTLTVP
jgi:hypothetical protein